MDRGEVEAWWKEELIGVECNGGGVGWMEVR